MDEFHDRLTSFFLSSQSHLLCNENTMILMEYISRQTTLYGNDKDFSSVIKLFSEALLCDQEQKIIQKEDYELKRKKSGVNRLWNSSIYIYIYI